MILRKPYAFLIKYFMIIHIVLSGLMIYVCLQYRTIISFIKEYINNTASISTADTIISPLLFIALLLIAVISGAIFWLMRYKKKPKLLYLLNIIVTIVLLILTMVLSSTFANLNNIIIDSKTIRLYRDMVNILLIVQYVLIIAMIIRTLGFDVKRFNFESDVQEMSIESTDNEEFEVNIGINTNKILRIIRRYLRELKYYYEENKLVIILLAVFVVFILFLRISPQIFGRERTHSQNEIVSTQNFQMNVTESYTSKLKYDGDDVSIKDSTYIIVRIDLLGLYNNKYQIDTSRIELKVGKYVYSPSLKQYNYFTDIGYGYNSQYLVYNTTKPYILVFIVDDKVIKKKKTLIYTDENLSERKIRIKPVNIDDVKEIETKKLTEELNYKDTIIGEGKFKINSMTFADNYETMYASPNNKIMKLEPVFELGKYNNFDFFTNFIKLYYTKDNKTYEASINNRTDRFNNDNVYLEVSKEVENADTIYLKIRIRDKSYKYMLKGDK